MIRKSCRYGTNGQNKDRRHEPSLKVPHEGRFVKKRVRLSVNVIKVGFCDMDLKIFGW
jgi:hypothetical protein